MTAANLTTPETTRSGHFHTTRDGTAIAADVLNRMLVRPEYVRIV